MGLRINTNMASISAQRAMGTVQKNVERAMKQLATGSRFADFSEGAAEHAIAEQIRGQVKSMEAAQNNAENAGSFVQVAEGGLNEQNNILIRLRELAIQSASDTFSEVEREFLDVEFQQLTSELDRIAKTTKFGTQSLLTGEEKEYEFQIGPQKGPDNVIKYKSDTDTTADALRIDGLTVAEKSDARDSLEKIDAALISIASARANFGGMQTRLDSVVNNSMIQIENLQAAHSRIADTDIAKSYSEMIKGQAIQQYQMAVLATANQWPGNALKLIG